MVKGGGVMPAEYYVAWWNLENLFDEENVPAYLAVKVGGSCAIPEVMGPATLWPAIKALVGGNRAGYDPTIPIVDFCRRDRRGQIQGRT